MHMAYIFCTNIGLKVRSWVLKCQIMKPMIELLKPMLEHHIPMIVVFQHRLEVQTQVCNSETYVCEPIVHLACHTRMFLMRHRATLSRSMRIFISYYFIF